jgi:ribosomal protein L24
MKRHVKKGDEVVVLAGKEKGKRGKIIAVLTKKSRVIVEGRADDQEVTPARASSIRRVRSSSAKARFTFQT